MRMGRSIYTDRGEKHNQRWISDATLSLWIGIGFLSTFLSSFSIDWKWQEIFGGGLKNGILNLWNLAGEQLGRSDYYLLEQLHTGSEKYGFALLVLGCILFLLSLAVVRIGNRWLLLLYLIPLGVMTLGTSLSPQYGSVIMLLSGLMAAFLYMGAGGRQGAQWIIGGVIILSLALGVGLDAFGSGIVMPPAKVGKIQRASQEKVEELKYGKMPLGQGEVTGKERNSGKGTAMEVTMTNPSPMYLRGFVGEDFGANRWITLNSATQYEKRQLDRRLWAAGYLPLSSTTKADGLLDPSAKMQEVTVNVLDGSGQYAFIPYEIGEDRFAGTKNVAGSYMSHKAGQALKEYSYKVGTVTIDHWPDQVSKLFATGENNDIANFLHNESYANAFVYERYTALSNQNRKMIYEELGTSGNQDEGHIDYKLAVTNIRKYMDEQITYSEKGWKTGSEDGIYDFFRYKKGYDVHYATVATMMFRYYGIPARYVEGYLLTPKDVEGKKQDEKISIPQKNAHSWTEIYIDGYGWVPIETCSTFYGIMPEPDLSIGLESESFLKPFQQPEQIRPSVPKAEVDDEEQKGKGRKLIWWGLLSLLICLALVILFILCKKMVGAVRRWRAFTGKDPKKALCAIYGYIQRKKWSPTKEERAILDKAAYSPYPMEDRERWQVIAGLAAMKEGKKKGQKKEKKKRREIKRESKKREREEKSEKHTDEKKSSGSL